jgi:type VII secretion protein EccB
VHTRRDQVQAHTFMVGRLVSALLRGEPDLATPPLRRTTLGLIVGCILGVIAVGGCTVYGIIRPSQSTAWRHPGTLIVDKQTGTRYVLAGGRLHPVLNYASARLLLGRTMTVALVPAATLASLPHGGPVGIPGAPDALPAGTGSGSGSGSARWLVCAGAAGGAGAQSPTLSVRIGPDDGARPLPADRAVLVRDAGGTTYLVWRGSRLRLAAPWVGRALGYDTSAALAVRDGWLGVLPAGPDLGAPAVARRGAPGPVLDGRPTVVGQLFGVPDPSGSAGDRHLYLLTADGLLPVSHTGATLVLADPASTAAYGGHPAAVRALSPAALAAARVLPSRADAAALPPDPPALLADPARSPCVRVLAGGDTVSLATVPATATATATARVPATAAPAAGAAASGAASSGVPASGAAKSGAAIPGAATAGAASSGAAQPGAPASAAADRVEVAPGSGALVRPRPAPGTASPDQASPDQAGPDQAAPACYLLTEDGTLFPIADVVAAGDLGYDPDAAVGVPADLLALLPAGPVLSRPRPGGGAGPP